MTWLRTSQGAINMDKVVRVIGATGTNGDAYFYLDHANYLTVPLGSTDAEAIERAQQLTRAVAPEDI